MKKDTKKVWQEMEKLGWSNEPKDFHLEYFEDIIESTKQAFSLTDVVGRRNQLCDCKHNKQEQVKLLTKLAEKIADSQK